MADMGAVRAACTRGSWSADSAVWSASLGVDLPPGSGGL